MEAAAKKPKVGNDLTQGSIYKTLIVFAVPIILTNLIQQLYSMVDLMVIGQFVGSVGTVGISTGGEIADLVTPVAMGFSTAGQIYIAQLIGARNERRAKKTIGTLLGFMLGVSALLMLAAIVFSLPILHTLNCPGEALSQARAYMIITALGYPFVFGYNAVCGILRGMGESKRPLYFISVAALINIGLDIFFVAVLGMQADGTAIATTLSQVGSFVASFRYLWKNREKFEFELSKEFFWPDAKILETIVVLGVPQVVRSLLVRFSLLRLFRAFVDVPIQDLLLCRGQCHTARFLLPKLLLLLRIRRVLVRSVSCRSSGPGRYVCVFHISHRIRAARVGPRLLIQRPPDARVHIPRLRICLRSLRLLQCRSAGRIIAANVSAFRRALNGFSAAICKVFIHRVKSASLPVRGLLRILPSLHTGRFLPTIREIFIHGVEPGAFPFCHKCLLLLLQRNPVACSI